MGSIIAKIRHNVEDTRHYEKGSRNSDNYRDSASRLKEVPRFNPGL
jgi:hypothetical protein